MGLANLKLIKLCTMCTISNVILRDGIFYALNVDQGKMPELKQGWKISCHLVSEQRKEGREERYREDDRDVWKYGDGCCHYVLSNSVVKMGQALTL